MRSYYQSSANQVVELEKLTTTINTDVCIIGGGYTGLSTALCLANNNVDVVLLEANAIASGASGANGGQISVGMRKDQLYLEETFGKECAVALWEIGKAASTNVKALIDEYNIDCDYKKGTAHPNHKQQYCSQSQRYAEHLQKHYNYDEIQYLNDKDMREISGSDSYYGGCYDAGSAHCHPLNYALGIAQAAISSGATMFINSKVLSYKIIDKKVQIKTKEGVVNADRVVLACNGYLENLEPRINSKILPMNNYIIATEKLNDDIVAKINHKDIAFADSRFVVNYYRLSADKRLLFGGGENYSQQLSNNIVPIVKKPMVKIYPFLKDVRIDYAWGGKLAITMNRMPVFKSFDNDKVLSAQGYSGQGVALASYAGKIIADKITGNGDMFNIMSNISIPSFPGGGMLRSVSMKLGMAYYAILDRL